MKPLVAGLAASVALGAAVGLGAFTFLYADGASYLVNDPAACANCHIMDEHYAAWLKSSHRAVATCNDCHTPHALIPKYATKASNGFWHSFAFTTGRFPYPLRIKQHNREIAERACRECHAALTAAMDVAARPAVSDEHVADTPPEERVACTRCHRYVGHWVR